MTSVDLSALPSVAFAPQSAGETETAIITAYEAIAKATLQPGDPVRLFLESLAYILSVQNGLIDLAGKQNLLAYARGGHLDHLGAPMGVIRIQPQPARTTVPLLGMHTVNRIRHVWCLSQPHIIIKSFRNRHFLRITSRRVTRQAHLDVFQLSDTSVSHQFTGITELFHRALLAANL